MNLGQVLAYVDHGGRLMILLDAAQLALTVAVAYDLFKPRGSRATSVRFLARYGKKVRPRDRYHV